MNERIFTLMEIKGLKINYLASSLGVKPSKVYDWKRKRSSPSSEEINAIAKMLGTTPAYLCGETEDSAPLPNKAALSSQNPQIQKILDLLQTLDGEALEAVNQFTAFQAAQKK